MAVNGTFYKQTQGASPSDNVFPDIATGRVRTFLEEVVITEAYTAASSPLIRIGVERLNPGTKILEIISLGATGYTSTTGTLVWADRNWVEISDLEDLTSVNAATEVLYDTFNEQYNVTTARFGNIGLKLASNEGLDLAAILSIGIKYVTD